MYYGAKYFYIIPLLFYSLFTITYKLITMKNLIGNHVRITSDNDNYDAFRNEILIITFASNEGIGYDTGMYPEMLCDFKIEGKPNKEFPFALYEYEFTTV